MTPPRDPFRWLRRKPDAPLAPPPDPVEIALGYHQRSKHHEQRFAASLGFLDWEHQPAPFRRYAGARIVALERPRDEAPRAVRDGEPSWAELLTPGAVPPRPLDARSLAHFFAHALALSASKRLETARWSLRVNPSSGNLHPTEGWAILPALTDVGDAPALFHYAPDAHVLEERASFGATEFAAATRGLAPGDVLLLLSSIPWREAWKYGERAWRYCRHDAGHALAALRYAAALCGWRLLEQPDLPHAVLASLLGLDRDAEFDPEEPEHPELLAVLRTSGTPFDAPPRLDAEDLSRLAHSARWSGIPNRLSSEHQPWDVLAVVQEATAPGLGFAPPRGPTPPLAPRGSAAPDERERLLAAGLLLRRRRSAVAMDGQTRLARDGFVRLLARSLPQQAPAPWDVLAGPPRAHLVLFVHRVDGVEPGLYLLPRAAEDEPLLRATLRPQFSWESVEGVPDEVPLRRLHAGDLRGIAARICCGQALAGDGVFAAAMLVRCEGELRAQGAPLYPTLFRETGVLGQMLYLEAEAAGLRATGIGCFFDDALHALLGLGDPSFQSLYHFAVGGALDDPRLTSEPAYAE